MDQEKLFHEDWRDALKHLVKALGGFDAVGIEIWPAKTRKAAGAWLSDCLNPERPAKLDLEEIQKLLQMGRDRDLHVGLYQLVDDLGYARPATRDPQDVEGEIARQMSEAMSTAETLLKRYDRLQQQKAVHQFGRPRAASSE
jgi:transposase